MKQEEIREIWEWCGFKPVKNKDCYALSTSYSKNHPEDICHWELWGDYCSLPELTLDNLFKYAVPEFNRKYGHSKTEELLTEWVGWIAFMPDEDPAEALGQAILKVIEK